MTHRDLALRVFVILDDLHVTRVIRFRDRRLPARDARDPRGIKTAFPPAFGREVRDLQVVTCFYPHKFTTHMNRLT